MKKYTSLAAMLMIVLFVVGLGFTAVCQVRPPQPPPQQKGITAYTPAPFVEDTWPQVLFVPDDPRVAVLPSNWSVVTVNPNDLDTVYKMTTDKAKIMGNPGKLYVFKNKPDNPVDIRPGK
jgi:hypothetical protein